MTTITMSAADLPANDLGREPESVAQIDITSVEGKNVGKVGRFVVKMAVVRGKPMLLILTESKNGRLRKVCLDGCFKI
jgi:hypothetical protein